MAKNSDEEAVAKNSDEEAVVKTSTKKMWESSGENKPRVFAPKINKNLFGVQQLTEKEKMLDGKIYDPSDSELLALRERAHKLSAEYNSLLETDKRRVEILKELGINPNVYLQGPVQFDYGCFTKIGDNTYANFNFTCLDCCPVTIGANVFFGPNVSILTPVHPLRWQDRNSYVKANGATTDKEYAKPITIGNNCWIAGNVTICGGVTIGEGCVIGAGSVVVRDIPSNSLAVGVPCKVIRTITEEDSLKNHPELF